MASSRALRSAVHAQRRQALGYGMVSAYDWTGQTLLSQVRRSLEAPSNNVRFIIGCDFARVGESMRSGITKGSGREINVELEFEWPERDRVEINARHRVHSGRS